MTDKRFRVGIVGATGAVGKEIVSILDERRFPTKEIRAFATGKSHGHYLDYNGSDILVKEFKLSELRGLDIIFLSAGENVSRSVVTRRNEIEGVFIDNSSAFRMDEDVPLVVPEINPLSIAGYIKSRVIANPNCTTIILALCLYPLHKRFGLERVVVSTYQSVSGAGSEAMEELTREIRELFNYGSTKSRILPHQIAFNLIPFIGRIYEDGYCEEEKKIIRETRKILSIPDLKITATTVRVPIYHCHCISVNVTLMKDASINDIREIFQDAKGVLLLDNPGENDFPMPFKIAGSDEVFVGRIRSDSSHPNTFNFYISGDNLRKGAALNAVQIAEILVKGYIRPLDEMNH